MNVILVPRFDLVSGDQFDRRRTAPIRFMLTVGVLEEIYRDDFGMDEEAAFWAAVWQARALANE